MNSREFAGAICKLLQQHGHQALLVGGCVRDLILGREPMDYDVCTDARPEQVISLIPDSLGVGAQFGVVLVPFGEHYEHKVEIATFRSDIGSLMAVIPIKLFFPTGRNKMFSGEISPSTAC